MLRSIIGYPYLALSVLFLTPYMLWMGRKIKKSPANACGASVHRTANRWARSILKICGARLHVTGLENIPAEGALLFVSNHQSDIDIVVFLSCVTRPIGFVAKIEMLKVPLMRTWMRHMRCVFLDRKDIRQSAKTILEGIGVLKSGHSLVLFPEGTRTRSNDTLPFKAGGFKLATKPKVPVVPVTISGTYKIMEENHYRIKPADVYVTFHPAADTASLDGEALAALPREVEALIKNGLGDRRAAL